MVHITPMRRPTDEEIRVRMEYLERLAAVTQANAEDGEQPAEDETK